MGATTTSVTTPARVREVWPIDEGWAAVIAGASGAGGADLAARATGKAMVRQARRPNRDSTSGFGNAGRMRTPPCSAHATPCTTR